MSALKATSAGGGAAGEPGAGPQTAWKRRLGALGVAGFLFFLIKGLLWLIVPGAIVAWRAMAG